MILDCGHELLLEKPHIGGAGYGTDKNRKTYCYSCLAIIDRQIMQENNSITLYYNHKVYINSIDDCGLHPSDVGSIPI